VRFSETCIRRPVLTTVIALAITLLGAMAFFTLGVREYPAVDPPVISITTSYPGAAAEVVQAQITEPIEEAVNTVAGIRNLSSVSREGASQVTVEFELHVDLDDAAGDVRDQLSRAVRYLPADVNPPILNKAHADASAFFALVVTSPTRTQLQLSAIADALREKLQTVPGIAGVDQPAEKRYAMRLWLDPAKMLAHRISPLDVQEALRRENVALPSGRVEGALIEMPVKTLSRLSTPQEFDALIVRRTRDRIVRLRDIGHAELGAQNERGALKVNGQPVAGLWFKPQPGANQVEIVDELQRRLASIRRELPDDVSVSVAFDNTQYVRRSIHEVMETIAIAFGLVVLVVFAFLRSWRSTLIPTLAIPVSIIGAFAVIAASGFSINVLTLLGIVLSIGLVVDDAIIVLENIHARIERGMAPTEAAIEGTREIFSAVISTTATLAIVFIPLLFMGGMSGRLFREFGVTIAGAILISALIALTLTPMLSARLLKGGHAERTRVEPDLIQRVEIQYAKGLNNVLEQRGWAIGVLLLAGAAIAFLIAHLPAELAPIEDRGRIWIRASAPEGTSYESMQALMDEVSAATAAEIPKGSMLLTQVPGVAGGPGIQGVMNSGFVRVFLPDREQRDRTQGEIARALLRLQGEHNRARLNITQEPTIGERRANQTGLQFVLQADTLDALRDNVPRMLGALRSSSAFSFVDSDLKFSMPELEVAIDRDRVAALGLNAREIAQALQAALSGQRMGYFILDGKQYDVIGQLARSSRASPRDLLGIAVHSSDGAFVGLENLVTLSETSSPPELYRYNRYSAATMSATLAPGYTMSEGIAELQRAAASALDGRVTTALTGAARDYVDSASSLTWVLLLAILFVYLVLAAQFESFLDPFIILLTVPLALAGALFSLWIFDQTLNMFSQIGLIMLTGLVTKNGILIVEFANQRANTESLPPLRAVQEAARARLRPILMTTLATVLGALPIALALGAGAESRMCMGIAVIGGLLVGSLLTLYVIPCVYALLKHTPPAASIARSDSLIAAEA
jgi:hydrophobe/amphiphile efflux-1 (HAE1) family protein